MSKKNHTWDETNTCIWCGLKRKRHTVRHRMAITNHPPYDHYMYERKMAYSMDGQKWSFIRPNCADISQPVHA